MTLGIYYEHMLAAARQRGMTLPALCAKVRALGYKAVAPQAAHIVRDAGLLPMLSSAGLRAEGIYERFLFESKAQAAQQGAAGDPNANGGANGGTNVNDDGTVDSEFTN